MAEALAETQVKDIMTTKIVAAQADDSVLDVARLLLEKDFDGLPVVDKKNRLVGMVTMKELLDQNGLYLPTVVKILNQLKVSHQEDITEVGEKLNTVKHLKVDSIMNRSPYYLEQHTSIEKAAEAFLLWRNDPLPVVDQTKTLLGVVSKYDLLKALTSPLQPVTVRPVLTERPEQLDVVENLEKQFVVVSKARVRFWYLALFVFLLLGIFIAIATIVRITTR